MAPVPRIAVILTGAIFFTHLFIPRLMPYCRLDPDGGSLQLGRFILAAFSTEANILSHFMKLIQVVDGAIGVEEKRVWKKNSDGLYFFLFVFLIFYTIGPMVGVYTFIDATISSIQWTLTQEGPNVPGFIGAERRCQPYMGIMLHATFGESHRISGPLLGIFAAHLFMYLTEFLPLAGGPKLFQTPPNFLKRWD